MTDVPINFKIKDFDKSGKIEVFDNKQKKYLPDNYYTYEIHRHLKTDFHNISPKKGDIIHICPFKIITSRPNKIIEKPFLQYLLYKYPESKKEVSNLCVFPFVKYTSGEILNISKTIIKSLFDTVYNPIGYIQNNNGIYIFYQIDFLGILVQEKPLRNSQQFIWATIYEICNSKKFITFPIHPSVSDIFYKNPKLIYLKDKEKKCIEIPIIAYVGSSQELLNYIATFQIKSSTLRTFGPYYYFTDFKQAIRRGGWSSNYEKMEIFNKNITNDNGKFKQGGIVRFALFLGNYRVVLNRKSDPLLPYVKKIDKLTPLTTEDIDFLKKGKGKWTRTYDALLISNFKNTNRSGYFWPGTGYVLKKYNGFTSLSIHLIDNSSLKSNWDMDYDLYKIK